MAPCIIPRRTRSPRARPTRAPCTMHGLTYLRNKCKRNEGESWLRPVYSTYVLMIPDRGNRTTGHSNSIVSHGRYLTSAGPWRRSCAARAFVRVQSMDPCPARRKPDGRRDDPWCMHVSSHRYPASARPCVQARRRAWIQKIFLIDLHIWNVKNGVHMRKLDQF